MKCDCLKDIKARLLEEQPYAKKTITDVSYPENSAVINGNSLDSVLIVRLELEIEGRKTPQKQKIIPSFCPFCGKRQVDKEKSS